MENQNSLQAVKVEVPGRHDRAVDPDRPKTKKKSSKPRSSEFVYVNNAYVGSLSSVNDVRTQAPPTSVVREQYWACSKWPHAQRILAVAVGLLLGAVIGLAVTLVINAISPDANLSNLFDTSAPD
ncbi:unnamed protein product [Arctia plantaginis]|uniref:Uncharacterized protein n=1 Tax=Arctia plantaginis TaxID=874455 RepID=A0A8S0ZEL2_ARCPL|nr:unnamed protein product [Arctia plantaginis]